MSATDATLCIHAEHDEAAEGTDGDYVRRERHHAARKRSLSLPDAVDDEAVSAKMSDGILTITLPKSEAAQGRRIDIE